jgi:hypothetical protein
MKKPSAIKVSKFIKQFRAVGELNEVDRTLVTH